MKRILGLLILIAILSGVLYWVYVTDEAKRESKKNFEGNALNEEKIMQLLEADNRKESDRIIRTAGKSPDQVIALNSLIVKMTYGKELDKKQLEALVTLQRRQFAKELLAENEKLNHQLKIWSETEKQKEKKVKVVDYKALAPYPLEKVKVDGVARNTVKVSVVYYTSISGNNLYVDYLLYEDEEKHWKIVGWAKGEEFLISE